MNSLKTFVDTQKVRTSKVQISLVQYSSTIRWEFPYLSDQNLMKERISQAEYLGQGTLTGKALDFITFEVIPRSRTDVANVVIIFTDGQSYDSVVAPANDLQNVAKVFAIGIGSAVKWDQLRKITNNDEDSVFMTSYNQLNSIMRKISQTICKDGTIWVKFW